MLDGERLTKDGRPLDTAKYPYQSLVGGLLYLACCTRPDIAFPVGVLSRFMSCPTEEAWKAAMNVLKYLKGTQDLGIVYGKSSKLIEGYADADYAGDTYSRKSCTGYVFKVFGGAVSWQSRLQPTVAVSTVEAEYMASVSATKEALWLTKLLRDLQYDVGAVRVWGDNQGALKLIKHPHGSQHIDVQHHFVRERVARGELEFEYVSTVDQAADILAKAVKTSQFDNCKLLMGLE